MDFKNIDISKLSSEEQKKLAVYIKFNQRELFTPMDWQKDFFKMGKDIQQRYLMAANRTGKSYASAFEASCHITGVYPDWWEGFRYTYPPNVWVLGESSEQMAAAGGYQEHLFGTFEDIGTGFVPKSKIIKKHNSQTKHAIKSVEVQHTHGKCRVDFKSYSQNAEALMGAGIDLILIDEEPKNNKIYGQLVTRIAAAKEHGRIILSATPELGKTPLVAEFMDETSPKHPGLINVTIWDAHEDKGGYLNDVDIKRIVDACPPHETDMRLKGIPKLGSGAIYPYTQESIEYDPGEVDLPQNSLRLVAADFGFNDPTALVWIAKDPDTGIVYITDVWKKTKADVLEIANEILAMQTNYLVYPRDGTNKTLQGGGISLADQLKSARVNLHWEPFQNPMDHLGKRNNSVEVGLNQIRSMMRIGLLKVNKNCMDFWNEQQTYQYGDDGKPQQSRKQGHHFDTMDAFRYGVMSIIQDIGTTAGRGMVDTDYHYDSIPYKT